MDKKPGICPLFDGIGLTSLVIAIFALGGSVWFVDAGMQGSLLQMFQIAFGTSIASFLVARAIQIVDVIRSTPDPKSLRVVAANGDSSLDTAASADDVVAGVIRRAA